MSFSTTQKLGMGMLIVALLLAGATAQATTFLDSAYGTPTATALPRSLAMGGTGVARIGCCRLAPMPPLPDTVAVRGLYFVHAIATVSQIWSK